ncbi:MAG: 2-phosphosulfolactate phosphatase [Chlorobi bacterium]|nr:2-phosphosulfolactate phosphatase [Chlorobiota bacterium]
MKIHTLLSPLNADELYFTGKTVVVIDVLRATSVILTALKNGAKEVIPVGTIEFAMKVSGNAFGGHTILGGERNTKKIEGFTFGNSPLEYTQENIEGKSIILFTTNGSKAIVKTKFAERTLIGSFFNLEALAEFLVSLNNDVEILCSGANGMFCLEDTVCAGKLIRKIQKLNGEIELTDASKASIELNGVFGKNIGEMLRNAEHGKKLIENGFEEDLDFISQIDIWDIIPRFESSVIKIMNNDEENK